MKKGSSLTFFASGGWDNEKKEKSAEKKASPSEDEAAFAQNPNSENWRKGWDSNPQALAGAAFQERWLIQFAAPFRLLLSGGKTAARQHLVICIFPAGGVSRSRTLIIKVL